MSEEQQELTIESTEELDHYISQFVRYVEKYEIETDRWFDMIKTASEACGNDVIKNSFVIREVLEHRFTERWAKFCRCWIRLRLQDAGFEELEDGGASIDDGRMSCCES